MLGALHPEGDREDIAWFYPLHEWLIERSQEGKRVRYRLRDTLPLKELVLAQMDGSFHLHGGKVEPNRDRQVITCPQRCVYLLSVHCRQAGQELRVVRGCFSLRNAKDALPLPVASDQGGNPEASFKHLLLLICGHVMVVVAATRSFRVIFQAQREPCSPERAVGTMFLEHGELWDEHLVDDVHDAVVRDHVRLEHMPSIDLDAFSDRGGYLV